VCRQIGFWIIGARKGNDREPVDNKGKKKTRDYTKGDGTFPCFIHPCVTVRKKEGGLTSRGGELEGGG